MEISIVQYSTVPVTDGGVMQAVVCMQVDAPSVNGSTPLSDACGRGNAACVSLLLQHGASPQGAATSASASPIHQAAARGKRANTLFLKLHYTLCL